MKKILIHSIAFNPDGVSTAYLYNDIAMKFKQKGFEVSVITTTPHYNVVDPEIVKKTLKKRCCGLYYTSEFNGIEVKHIPQKKFKSSMLRILGFIYWHLAFLFIGLFEKNIDVILSPSPPLTIGYINIILGKIKRSKVIYNVQEIYPDLLIEEGKLKSKTTIDILQRLEKYIYDRSDKVITIDKVFYDTIIDRFKDRSKLEIIPNFVDVSIYKPLDRNAINLDEKLFPQTSSLKIVYAGNIGYAQDWEILINVATALKDENIEFFVIGEGVMKNYLAQKVKEKNLEKVHLLSYQPRDMMPSIIAYSDLQFIFMSPQVEGHGFPSKVYTIMACEKPILVCSGESTPIINFLRDIDCAFLITEKDLKKKEERIIEILKTASKDLLQKMGKNGLNTINSNYTKEIVTDRYIKLINSILK